MVGIESYVTKLKNDNKSYWHRNKKDILEIADKYGKLNTLKVMENAKAKRMRLREGLNWTYQLNTCINDLRAEGYTLRSISKQLNLNRRSLFSRRVGAVNKYLILQTLQACEAL
ncbi:hypothetical protein CMI37_27420 [Candidatus Pacearchaeota archaeon]|nr:hypothetical protein [Candidatus Pacearchaeota archaeon]